MKVEDKAVPIYEYCCPGCGLRFELMRPMSRSDEDAPCPGCNNGAKRALSSFAAFSKGSGGESAPVSGGGGCGSCSAGTCSSCSH